MSYEGSLKLKSSDETFDFLCTTCAESNKTAEAIKFCVQCGIYCCQTCLDAHQTFPALKSHNLLDIVQGQQAGGQQPRFLEVPIQRCHVHQTKVVDMYCEFHDEVGCTDCFFSNHQACKKSNIHSIPDTIDTIFKSKDCEQTYSQLTDAIISMDTVGNDKETRLQNLTKARNDALCDVDSTEQIQANKLKKAAETSRQKVETVYKQLKTETIEEKQSVTNTSHNLQTIKDEIDRSESNRAERWVNTKLAQTQLRQAAILRTSHFQQRNPDVKLSFTPDQSLNESRDIMYVGDEDRGLVCLDGMGNYLYTITDTDLKGVMGACVDARGNMFVAGSHNVVQVNDNGKKVGLVLNENDGLNKPLCMCFDKKLNRMYVTMWSKHIVKIYELE